jgi:hypothetical protein
LVDRVLVEGFERFDESVQNVKSSHILTRGNSHDVGALGNIAGIILFGLLINNPSTSGEVKYLAVQQLGGKLLAEFAYDGTGMETDKGPRCKLDGPSGSSPEGGPGTPGPIAATGSLHAMHKGNPTSGDG